MLRPRSRVLPSAILGALLVLAAASPAAADDYTMPESKKPTAIPLCQEDGFTQLVKDCAALLPLAGEIETALARALSKVGPLAAPLLKRDQVWFREIVARLGESALAVEYAPDGRDQVEAALNARRKMLDDVTASVGHAGFAGRWSNAFGTIEITPEADSALRVKIATDAAYSIGREERMVCEATATVRAEENGWHAGPITADPAVKGNGKAAPSLRLIRHGETLRVVAGDDSAPDSDSGALGCGGPNQITGTYFAVGGGTKGNLRPAATPTFDCTKPSTSADEEVCADPELSANDQRLNAAWSELLPRLDAETKRALKEDQRSYVAAQAAQYPQFVHPAWDKRQSDMHHTGAGRDMLAKMQRERIALLEGFDETRRGFEGLWLASNALLKVRVEGSTLSASGGKWFQGDWKGGCEYSFEGSVQGSAFRSAQEGFNPDTLEREHATLIVNRADDRLAPRRSGDNGAPDPEAGEPKCRRNVTISSTARLFPVRPSPDIGTSDAIR